MTYHLFIRDLAKAEFAEAVAWYNTQAEGLGDQLVEAVEGTLERIEENPWQWPRFHKEVQRTVVKRFPYLIYYRVVGKEIIVLRIVHGSREPQGITDTF